MQSTQFTNPAYPHYQHMEVLSNRYLRAANALKSVILISKHLTLEWWLLAGGYPCCLSRLHLKKMTELLSDTYSTVSVQWARSYYRRLLWSSSNFPKLHWPLVSAKLDWLEWFSLESRDFVVDAHAQQLRRMRVSGCKHIESQRICKSHDGKSPSWFQGNTHSDWFVTRISVFTHPCY